MVFLQVKQSAIESKLSALKTTSDQILTNNCKSNETTTEIQKQLLQVVEEWSRLIVEMSEFDRERIQADKEWKDFELLAKHLAQWLEEMKQHLENIDAKIKNSSVETLKYCFHEISVSFFKNIFLYCLNADMILWRTQKTYIYVFNHNF